MREFVPGSVAGWSRRSILWYSMLLLGTITSWRIIESLLRRLVLILEIRDRSVLPHHFCCMQLEVLGGIIHGTHYVLLHEIVFDEIGEPDAFAQDTLDFHQSLAMCQQIGVQIFVEENIRSHIAGTGIPRIREEIRIRFLRDIIHWFHHLGISIRIGSDVVDKLLGSSCHFLLVFGRICKITWANILANIFLFIIFLYNISNCSKLILQI